MKPRRRLWLWIGAPAALIIVLAVWLLQPGWRSGTINLGAAPPRAAATPLPPPAPSSIALPIHLPLALLEKAVNDAVPATLWQIDEPGRVCVPAARIKLFDTQLKITPDIKCRIVGDVERGPIRLSGRGRRIHVEMPLSAAVSAQDIGGIIKQETATATALVTAELRPTLTQDGRLTARIDLDYDWQQEPGITLMGQRIRFTEKIDRKLAPVLARAEVTLARELESTAIKSQVEAIWRQGFTVEEINKRNPAAWLRLTPQGLGVGRIAVEGRTLHIDAVLNAIAEVKLGRAPDRPPPVPLPPIAPAGPAAGLILHTAVLSDYATLEPVIGKALTRISANGIMVPDYGRVKVRFGRPTLYATDGGRLALGLDIVARGPRQLLDMRGRVWLTAKAVTAPNSQRVLIRDLQLLTDHADGVQLPLLVAVAVAEPVRLALEQSLAQDFSRDYAKLMTKIDTALTAVKIGDFQLKGELRDVRHGKVLALGQGLYLPIEARGAARIDYAAPR
jgi:hypothetical protein